MRSGRSRGTTGLATIVALGLSVSAVARAQTAPSDAQQRADALVEQGVGLRQRGDDDGALARFREAYALIPSARSLAQIALAEQAIGDWLRADRDLRQALEARDEPWIERNRGALSGALEQIARRIGTVDVRVNVPGAELWVDGARLGALPLAEPARVVAGAILLEVRAEGFATLRRSVEVRGMSLVRETFNLVRIATDEAPRVAPIRSSSGAGVGGASSPIVPTPQRGGGVPVGAVVLTASGAVALGAAAVFGVMRGAAIGPCRIAGDTLVCPTAAAALAAEAGRTHTTLANVTLVAGGLTLVGGASWMLVAALGTPAERPAPVSRAGVTVAPMVTSATSGLSIFGSF